MKTDQQRLEELFNQRQEINKKIKKINNKLEKERGKQEQKELKNLEDLDEKIKYFLFEDGFVSEDRYKEREKFWWDNQMLVSGYYPELEQSCIKVMITSKTDLKKLSEFMNKVVKHMRQFKNGFKQFGIFEHTCSEFGVYNLRVKDDNWYVVKTTFGRESVEKEFDRSLENALFYIKKFHYYDDED